MEHTEPSPKQRSLAVQIMTNAYNGAIFEWVGEDLEVVLDLEENSTLRYTIKTFDDAEINGLTQFEVTPEKVWDAMQSIVAGTTNISDGYKAVVAAQVQEERHQCDDSAFYEMPGEVTDNLTIQIACFGRIIF